MALVTFSLRELVRRLDGVTPQPFELPEVPDSAGQFVEVQQELQGTDFIGRALFLPVQLGDLVLPNEPVMRITNRKRIVETALVGSGRRGTVKEHIATEDYRVDITGFAVQTENTSDYPEDLVRQLNELYLRNEALEIRSGLTQLLGIYRVVIKAIDLPEIAGYQHVQAYRFECVSDEDFILDL